MLQKIFSLSLFIAVIAASVMISSLNAQDIGKSMQTEEHNKMKSEALIDNVIKADINGDGKVFVCTMGCEIKDASGECSICGMDLKEMSIEDAKKMMLENHHKMMKDKTHMKNMMGEQRNEKKSNCSKTSEGCSAPCTKDIEGTASHMEVKPWNSVCPVMGNEVDVEGPTVEYNGKVYGFCCPKCAGKFESDPEKYSKNLSEDGTKFLAETK